jgi:hypothetical protein
MGSNCSSLPNQEHSEAFVALTEYYTEKWAQFLSTKARLDPKAYTPISIARQALADHLEHDDQFLVLFDKYNKYADIPWRTVLHFASYTILTSIRSQTDLRMSRGWHCMDERKMRYKYTYNHYYDERVIIGMHLVSF